MDFKTIRCILWTPFFIGLLLLFGCQSNAENQSETAENQSEQIAFCFAFEDSLSFLKMDNSEAQSGESDIARLWVSPENFQVILFLDEPNGRNRIDVCSLYVHSDSLYSHPISLNCTDLVEPYRISRVLISDKQHPDMIYFSSVAIGSEREQQMSNDKCLPRILDLPENDSSGLPHLFGVTLVNVNSATPEECGYKNWSEGYISTSNISYSINVCGDPCNPYINPGHRIGKSHLTLQREEKEQGQWLKKGEPQIVESGDGKLGVFSFFDYHYIDNSEERYQLSLLLEDAVIIIATLPVSLLLNPANSGFWDSPVGAGPCQGYIYLDLCDVDLTKEGPVVENAAWPFYISGPKECPDGP